MHFSSSVSLQHMQSCRHRLPAVFVCSAPKGFPRWKEWWCTDVYCNHIPFQTHVAFCCQWSSVADPLDLISKRSGTNLPLAVLHTKRCISWQCKHVPQHGKNYLHMYCLMRCIVVTHVCTTQIKSNYEVCQMCFRWYHCVSHLVFRIFFLNFLDFLLVSNRTDMLSL